MTYVLSVGGSLAFTFASYVYLVEVTHSYNPFARPDHSSWGYAISLLNLGGSLLFLLASGCYFVQVPPHSFPEPWEFYVNLWCVRFGFAVGSACFVLGSLLSLPEALAD